MARYMPRVGVGIWPGYMPRVGGRNMARYMPRVGVGIWPGICLGLG